MARKTEPFPEYEDWSTAKFWGFIRSALRSAWSKWPPKYKVLAKAKRNYTGPKKLQKYEFQCAICTSYFPAKEVSVDHIVPAGTLKDYSDLPDFVSKLFVGEDMLRVLCNTCHQKVTNEQRKESFRVLYKREESTYRNMLSRCYNPNSTGYEHYGGRGIKVDPSWKESFLNFYMDMGNRPENTTLDRINVNGDYTKENCRWANNTTQANNRANNNTIMYNDQTLTISEWAEKLNIKPNTLSYRLLRGWTVEEALGKIPRDKPSKKLLQGDVLLYIQKEVAEGRTQTSIAKELGIDSSVISRALKQRS